MPDANGILLFMAATLTLNVIPGPDMLYVIARSVSQGRSAGVVSSLGIAAGCIVHTLLVACGVAGLLMAVPIAYAVIKYAGAAYLVYLGVRTLTNPQQVKSDRPIKKDDLGAIFLQGMMTNVLNPKVALFFLALLPQFVDQSRGNVAVQIALLGMLFNTTGTLVNVIVALAASFTGQRFKAWVGESVMFRWLTGGVLIGLGVRLALLERR
jgi:threonine/homoserine/homoserine lactone efflux protein